MDLSFGLILSLAVSLVNWLRLLRDTDDGFVMIVVGNLGFDGLVLSAATTPKVVVVMNHGKMIGTKNSQMVRNEWHGTKRFLLGLFFI
jgi:hypothetical protein